MVFQHKKFENLILLTNFSFIFFRICRQGSEFIPMNFWHLLISVYFPDIQ